MKAGSTKFKNYISKGCGLITLIYTVRLIKMVIVFIVTGNW